ncbi:helix-turn-helix domain-containing protein [Agromyces aurantiacus]|uniref:Helix-turn-helix domain-containing protein n=2 Tax=Agromyces aurantiacus TaxID=165814 RepID=A0ABV9R801_9MICO|nr:helix-turn-helix domain-containing protein [Agromyces aurantiacus]MBM7504056.1 AraC-like DNA-binding protein [Agromyces aurantiacus]
MLHAPETSAAPALPAPLDFTEFSAMVSQSFVPLRVHADRPEPFRGEVRTAASDEVHLSVVTADAHEIQRTPALVARKEQRYFKLGLQLSGTGLLIQDGREAVVRPGDLAIYDTNTPYTLVFEERFSTAVLMVPHRLIELPTDAVRAMTATTVSREDGLAHVVSGFLGGLAGQLDQLDGPVGARLARNAVDLVTTMYAQQLDLARDADKPHRPMLRRVQAYIDEHLPLPDLNPSTIAAAHFISTRHLHAIFHEEGLTVSTWIRARRLDRCRRELVDPLAAHRPVSEIAARWGFPDAAHFSRAFRAEFGEPPSAVRARAIAG